jgi:hypothetical protein
VRFAENRSRRRGCGGVMSRWFVRMCLGRLRGLLCGRRQHDQESEPAPYLYNRRVCVVFVFNGVLRRKSELSIVVKRKCHPRCASMGAGIGSSDARLGRYVQYSTIGLQVDLWLVCLCTDV